MKKVREILGFAPKEGDVGIEIEVEATGKALPSQLDWWNATVDHSLRGNSMEYVMPSPVAIEDVNNKLIELYSAIDKAKATPRYSFRAGVHVHVNCLELTTKELLTFIMLYYSLEDILVEWCGDDRVGNLFCLRGRDAQYLSEGIGHGFKSEKSLPMLITDSLRYSSLNVSSLGKYGTLEFRALGTYPKFEKIDDWANILVTLRNKAIAINNPEALIENFSMVGPVDWLKECVGEYEKLFNKVENRANKCLDGLRFAQDIYINSL